MKKLIKYVAMALVVAMTFSTATVSAYAYTPTDLSNLSYTTTYYWDSTKMPILGERELFWDYEDQRENPEWEKLNAYYDFEYKNVKGKVSIGNVLCVLTNAAEKGCLAKGTVVNPVSPNMINFVDASGKQLCGTKNPIVAELDNKGDVTYRVSDNNLFRGNTEILWTEEEFRSGKVYVHIAYKIYGSQVVPGYEVKLGKFVGSNYSNRKIVSEYQDPFNVFSYDVWDDEKNFTRGEVCFSMPLSECGGQTLDLTFNGVKVGKYKIKND